MSYLSSNDASSYTQAALATRAHNNHLICMHAYRQPSLNGTQGYYNDTTVLLQQPGSPSLLTRNISCRRCTVSEPVLQLA